MRDFVLFSESCCDLTADEVRELELSVVPLHFAVDGVQLTDTPDHASMSPDVFYEKLAAGAECKTSAANVGEYTAAMQSALDSGRDILFVCFSSALSTTYQSACIAAEDLREAYPDAKIIVIDSLSASRGLGMLLWRAAEEKRKGKTIDEVADFVRAAIPTQCHWFTVDSLDQLKRGGRISATTAVVGGMLNIKPVMHEDAEGRLTSVGKARGIKAALTELVNTMERIGKAPLAEQTVFLCHAACPEHVAFISGLLRERFGITDIRVGDIGPVIGSHTGRGTLGLFFVGNER